MKLKNTKKESRQEIPSFGAFVITHERTVILQKTIQKLREQSFAPEHILIVDNSESEETAEAVRHWDVLELEYLRVGHNSGPAGAAKIGLEVLTERGFRWIYWGDDDNPPEDNFVFERCFNKIAQLEKKGATIGIFGGRGGQLNKVTGRIRSLSNAELLHMKVVEVDSVPGGHTMIVNSEVVREGILPLEKLFFGFEELDFCLRARKKGFPAFVDAESWLNANYEAGHQALNYRWKGSTFGKEAFFWRDYYSTRNLLYIYYRERYFIPFTYLFFKTMLKSLVGFRYGLRYGRKNFLVQWKSINDFLGGNFGFHRLNDIK